MLMGFAEIKFAARKSELGCGVLVARSEAGVCQATISESNFGGAPLIRTGSKTRPRRGTGSSATRSDRAIRRRRALGTDARETKTIPIVFVYVADPIGSGFAPSLARPGGNVTGFTYLEPTMGGKLVGLLKEIAPRTTHMALLFKTPAKGLDLPLVHSSGRNTLPAVASQAAPAHARDEIEVG